MRERENTHEHTCTSEMRDKVTDRQIGKEEGRGGVGGGAALQAMQRASSSSCCGFGSTWRFPSIQYGLHAILPWSAAVWTVCVGCVGKVYSRKLRRRLLQHCDHAVLPCRKCRRLGMLEIGGKGDCNH